jgi:hypothetical protein
MDMSNGGRESMGSKTRKIIKAILGLSLCLIFVNCAGGRQGSVQRDMDIRLIRAAETGKTAELKRLINLGADINAMDKDGWTPYLAASSNGQFESMRVLKALGARTSTYLDQGPMAIR